MNDDDYDCATDKIKSYQVDSKPWYGHIDDDFNYEDKDDNEEENAAAEMWCCKLMQKSDCSTLFVQIGNT